MASGIGTTGGRRVARGLLLAAGVVLMASCTINIPLSPALDLPQTGPRIPLTIGVYYSPEFQAHEAVEQAGTSVPQSWLVRPLGQASVRVFDRALSTLFEKVVHLASRPPLKRDGSEVALVVEPRIEAANFGPPIMGVGQGPAVWAVITYGITMYSPKGDLIGSWRVRGIAEVKTQIFRELQVWGRATDRAIQDAVTKFVKGFRDVPEVRRWLRELRVRSAGQQKAD